MGLSGFAAFCCAELVGTEFKLPALVQPLAPAAELPVFWLFKLAATKWLLYWDCQKEMERKKEHVCLCAAPQNTQPSRTHKLVLNSGMPPGERVPTKSHSWSDYIPAVLINTELGADICYLTTETRELLYGVGLILPSRERFLCSLLLLTAVTLLVLSNPNRIKHNNKQNPEGKKSK